ncbi:Uncharacterised protein [Vibrio cholerae]|nr:Uncharacterised protein [Vibrio cholerae]
MLVLSTWVRVSCSSSCANLRISLTLVLNWLSNVSRCSTRLPNCARVSITFCTSCSNLSSNTLSNASSPSCWI